MDRSSWIQEFKQKISFAELVGETVQLRKIGSQFTGLCPFHSEKSPSFTVNEEKKLFHCYGCKAGGDLIQFYQQLHSLSFREAVEELAEKFQLPIAGGVFGKSDVEPEAEKRARERSQLAHRLLRFCSAYYRGLLGTSAVALKYLANRGVSAELAETFYLGYAPDEWRALETRLREAQAPLDLAKDLGLLRGTHSVDLFRNRLLFPLVDLRGKVLGFGGRLLPGENQDGPKYLNSPESFVFSKSRFLFGLPQAQKAIRETGTVILSEGYFDVLALHGLGIRETVGTCGTALTLDHLKMLKRFQARIIVLFDGDRAGRDAQERAMRLGLREGELIYGVEPPLGDDPDTWARRAPDEVRAAIANPICLIDQALEQELRECVKGPEAKTKATERVFGLLAELSDPVAQEVRLGPWLEKAQLPRSVWERWSSGEGGHGPVAKVKKPEPPSVSTPTPSAAQNTPALPIKMTRLDRLVLIGGLRWAVTSQVFREIELYLPEGSRYAHLLTDPGLRTELAGVDPAGWFDWCQSRSETAARFAREAMLTEWNAEQEKILNRAIWEAGKRHWARISQETRTRAIGPENTPELLQEFLDQQRKMRDFQHLYEQSEARLSDLGE